MIDREPDPEGDSADNARELKEELCSNCGEPLDEAGDCIDSTCPDSPMYLDDDEEEDFPEGLLGEGDDDA